MDRLFQDLRYGARMLWKAPGFTAAAVATLAIGIGANACIFGLVNALLLRTPPGIVEPDRLVMLYTEERGTLGVSSYVDFRDFRELAHTLSGLAAYKPLDVDLSVGDRAERVPAMMVTAGFFDLLGLPPARGRFFRADEDREPGGHPLAVLSHSLWVQRFGASPRALGRSLLLNGRQFTVVGVAPAGFRGPSVIDEAAIFVPMSMQPDLMPGSGNLLDSRGWGGVLVVGRLAPGVGPEAAAADLRAIGAGLVERYPSTNEGRGYHLVPYRQATLPPGLRGDIVRMSGLLMSVVGLVLLVACVNVANLLLARSRNRRREIAVRQAMGAGRSRIVGQLLVEALLLAALGGVVALLLAQWGADLMPRLPLPEHFRVVVDGRVLGFTLALTAATGLLFGLAPAVRSTRLDLNRELKVERGGVDTVPRLALGSALVVGQVALSLILVVVAALFARTLWNLAGADLGFEPRGLLVAEIDPSLQGYGAEETELLYRRLLERLRGLPGIEAAGVTSVLPGASPDRMSARVEGAGEEEALVIDLAMVSDDYFRTLEIPLLRGRSFDGEDGSGPPPVILNRSAAKLLEGTSGRDPLGIRLDLGATGVPPLPVVGVVADSVGGEIGVEPRPLAYVAHRVMPDAAIGARMHLVARVQGVPTRLAGEARAIVQEIDPDLPVVGLASMEEELSASLATPRLAMVLTGTAAAVALLLAAVGLYGVLAFSVSRRTAEVGIRRALGADSRAVAAMILGQGLRLVLVGVGLGTLASLAAGRLVRSFLYGVDGTDPASFVVAAVLLVAVAVVAAWVPARRATRIDPATALRQD